MKIPSKLKTSLCIWLGLFPLSVATNFLLKDLLVDWHPICKIMITTLIIVPIMVYFVIPLTTKYVSRFVKEK